MTCVRKKNDKAVFMRDSSLLVSSARCVHGRVCQGHKEKRANK